MAPFRGKPGGLSQSERRHGHSAVRYGEVIWGAPLSPEDAPRVNLRPIELASYPQGDCLSPKRRKSPAVSIRESCLAGIFSLNLSCRSALFLKLPSAASALYSSFSPVSPQRGTQDLLLHSGETRAAYLKANVALGTPQCDTAGYMGRAAISRETPRESISARLSLRRTRERLTLPEAPQVPCRIHSRKLSGGYLLFKSQLSVCAFSKTPVLPRSLYTAAFRLHISKTKNNRMRFLTSGHSWIPAASYPPGPLPAKYFQRLEA